MSTLLEEEKPEQEEAEEEEEEADYEEEITGSEEEHWHIETDSPNFYWMDYCEDFYVDEIRDMVSSFEQAKRAILAIKHITRRQRWHMIKHIQARTSKTESTHEAVSRRAYS